jgi:UDP-N-acetylmuramate dehydrogenase
MLEEQFPLRGLNSFGVEARARWFCRVRTAEDLAALASDPSVQGMPRLVLGGGSNLLLTRDFEGLVIKVEVTGLRELGDSGDAWHLEVGGGEGWHGTVARLLELERPGLENLALIPGTCGAAPIQNIGAYGLEVAERIHSVTAWDFEEQRVVNMSAAECAFGYRDSVFKRRLAGRRLVLSVRLALPKQWQPRVGYLDVARALQARGITRPNARQVFEAVVAIRGAKLPDPALIGNAGSFFKNPTVPTELHQRLLAEHPALVGYPLPEGRVKLAAGWLIEAAGLRGITRGRAGVYEKQALVLVNRGGATGAEILALAREVQGKVAERFGVWLEPEPLIL